MEAPKKKIVAKVTANIYDPNAKTSPNLVTANVVRAKVSTSSVTRANTVINGSHSRNNSVTRTANRSSTIQLDELSGLSLPIMHSSAPPSSVGRSSGMAISPNSLFMSPDASPSPVGVSPSTRQQPRITVRQPKRMETTQSPLDLKFKAHQSYESPPISPPTSPRSLVFSALSAASPASQTPATSPSAPVRPRVNSSIRIPQTKVAVLKANGGQSTPTGLGHRPRTPSVSSTPPVGAKARVLTAPKAIPSQILTPPRLEIPQSPPGSTLSSRSSASAFSSAHASSLSSNSHLNVTASPNGDSDVEQGDSFEFDRASTPQNGPDEDDIFAEEARANRKILDLEISNQSLLTVNTMLEATKLRQAQEIKELRRKLREVRHLPAKPLYVNPESMSPTTSDLSLPANNNSSPSSDEEEEEPDPTYDRIQKLVEGLLSQAHRALERSIDDCMPTSTNTVKVLNAAEVKQYERRVQGLEPLELEEKTAEEGEGDGGEGGHRKDEDGDLSIDSVGDAHWAMDDPGYIASGEESRRRRQPLMTLA